MPIGDTNMDTPDLSWLITQGGIGGGLPGPASSTAGSTTTAGNTSVSGVDATTSKSGGIADIFSKDTLSTAEAGVDPTAGYQAPSSTPTLAPTVRIGETANDVPKSDPEVLQETFRSLVAELPSQLRSQLMKDMAKPGDQREAEFIALENSLMGQAKQLEWSKQVNASHPVPPGGQVEGAAELTPQQIEGRKKGIIIPATIGQVGKVDPSTMTPDEMAATLRANALNVMENQTKVVQSLANSLQPTDPAHPLLMEFLKFLSEALESAKQFLHEMRAIDADISRKSTIAMSSMQEDKFKAQLQSVEKQAAQRKKQQTTSVIMKIMGPIVAIGLLALVIVSGGSATAIAIAAIAAYVTMMASTTDIIDKFTKAFIQAIQEVFKAMGLPQDAVDALTGLVMAVLIIAAILITKNVASMDVGGMVAADLGAQTAAITTSRVGTMVALEVGVMCIQSTSCISMIVKPFLKALGVDEQTAEIVAMVVQMIVMLAMAIAGGYQIWHASSAVAKSAAGVVSKDLQTVAEALQLAENAVQVLIQSYSAVAHFQMADMAKYKAHLDKMITEMDTSQDMAKAFLKSLDQSTKSLTDLITFYSNSFSQIIGSMQRAVDDATSI